MCEPCASIEQWHSVEVPEKAVETVIDNEKEQFLAELNRQRLIGKQLLLESGDLDGAHGDIVAQFNSETTDLDRLRIELRGAAEYLKEIDGFYHLSRFGMGHHEAEISRGIDWLRMPTHTDYEVNWWDRQVKFDSAMGGAIRVHRMFERNTAIMEMVRDAMGKEAMKACIKYAERTSIGNPGTLRRFLEETLLTTTRVVSYQEPLRRLFNQSGLAEYDKRIKLAQLDKNWMDLALDERIRLIKVVCGLTRKRQFMVSEWADVPQFWAK